ncbi:MAG: protein kinase domain-containing protein [Acidobacteriota bacterium]
MKSGELKKCRRCQREIPASSRHCPECGVKLARNDTLIGTTLLGKYKIEAHLGAGGMCDVYRARHIFIDKLVALKLLKPEFASDPAVVQRFEREARATSRVAHPHAVTVTDFGVSDDVQFIVMEYIEGETLAHVLETQGPQSIGRTSRILRQVAGALEAAHTAGVIHRDIKPSNIILSRYEGGDWAWVVDFGVSKILEDLSQPSSDTTMHVVIGTPRYMSPEQCEGTPLDRRSDIYSLGIVLYEMLAGTAPFEESSSAIRMCMMHAGQPPRPLRQIRPELPAEVEAAVNRALAKNPDDRPATTLVLADEFEQAIRLSSTRQRRAGDGPGGGPVASTAVPDEPPTVIHPRVAKSTGQAAYATANSRWRKPVWIGALALLVLVVGLLAGGQWLANRGSVGAQSDIAGQKLIGESQQSVTQALVLMRSLPTFHPKRKALLELLEWEKTLAAYSGNPGPTDRMKDDALRFRQKADALSIQIRAELKKSSRPQPAVQTPLSDDETASLENAITAPVEGEGNEEDDNTSDAPSSADRDQVVATLQSWVSSLRKRDLAAHIEHYDETLDTYYLKRGIDRSQVSLDRARASAQYRSLQVDLSNIAIRFEAPNRAVATFDKTWNFEGDQPSSGTVRERVWLRQVNGRWRITGERDLKVMR